MTRTAKSAPSDSLPLMEQRLIAHMDRSLEGLESRVGGKISDLTSAVDRYLKRTETWHDEFQVLRARYNHLIHVLDQKGILAEEETHPV